MLQVSKDLAFSVSIHPSTPYREMGIVGRACLDILSLILLPPGLHNVRLDGSEKLLDYQKELYLHS